MFIFYGKIDESFISKKGYRNRGRGAQGKGKNGTMFKAIALKTF